MDETLKTYRLDLIRGVMCIMIFNCHFLNLFNGLRGGVLWNVLSLFSDTRLGLDYFFILSGFVITYSLSHKHTSMVPFAIKRFFRLFPVVLISLIGGWFICEYDWLYLHNLDSIQTQSQWTLSLYNFQNSIPTLLKDVITTMFMGESLYDANLWTISYELYVPIILALLIGRNYKASRSIYVFTLLIIIACILAASKNPLFSNTSYVLCFFIGGLLYYNIDFIRTSTRYTYLICIVLFVLFEILANIGNVRVFGISTLLAALTLFPLLVIPEQIRLLDNKVVYKLLHFVGGCSYEIYAIHLLLLASLSSYMALYLPWSYSQNVLITYVVTLLVTILVGGGINKICVNFIYPKINQFINRGIS